MKAYNRVQTEFIPGSLQYVFSGYENKQSSAI
jgi:hypothetical protein